MFLVDLIRLHLLACDDSGEALGVPRRGHGTRNSVREFREFPILVVGRIS